MFSIPTNTQKKESSRRKRRVSCVYGALAAGKNVYLSIHDDKDFITCATSIHMRTGYQLDDLPVVYFCFPRLAICLPLRAGDILFFNPREPHAVSSRIKNEDMIYCLSLYLKSANMGLNDNSIPLTQEYFF